MRFSWHNDKAAKNLQDHGVSFDEAATVFDHPLARDLCDDLHSWDEPRYYTVGPSSSGRLLLVCWTLRNDERGEVIHLISAREPEPREKRQYEASEDFA